MKRELDNMVIQYDLMNGKLEELATVLSDIEKRDDEIYRTIFEAGPIPQEVRTAGFGVRTAIKTLKDSQIPSSLSILVRNWIKLPSALMFKQKVLTM